ncbi:glutamate synthase large subunit [Sebaldella sp. S0638]|uniref:glutamate synthase large subunit n=1 Tax=Sebaldella sp. S0638 TaxID=2957809 RepID=UPI0020A11CFA|nr:glutamate synthase large subunit [Sebaldella sp. S0638]MCP1223461.1 glutamate synthase large subunit [Sebaldella sp. S0638]
MENKGFMEKSLFEREFEKDNCGMGFIANIDGVKTNRTIKDGIKILMGLEHRGASGYDSETGDGAGLLFEIPDAFFRSVCDNLPEEGEYGTGNVFLPVNPDYAAKIKETAEKITEETGESVLFWRKVPVNKDAVGVEAQRTLPEIEQFFIKRTGSSKEDFEKKLYIIRKKIENKVKTLGIDTGGFYITKLSSKTIIYKGLIKPDQIEKFYLDLQSDKMKSQFCLVHQRFSTNTFPKWELAHPFRFLAHNGEINTVKGNVNWMVSREPALSSEAYPEIKDLFPVNDHLSSDSANLDAALEFLLFSGKTLVEAVSILVPAAWEKDNEIPEKLKNFYDYYSSLMEPWDGPAALAMTDGRYILAKLDRNGLRPLRYLITNDNYIIAGSEVGTLPTEFSNIKESGRVRPGEILLVDMAEGKVLDKEETLEKILNNTDYTELLQNKKNVKKELEKFEYTEESKEISLIEEQLRIFGYTREDLSIIISEMASSGNEPLGSMGNDAALAVFSEKPRLLFNYFKQLFAQVTNPPIDSIREKFVMSLRSELGTKGNLLFNTEENSRTMAFESPVIDNKTLDFIKNECIDTLVIKDIIFDKESETLEGKLDEIFISAEKDIDNGKKVIILSDKKAGKDNIPIPSLMATAGLHHYLIEKKKRSGIDIIIETGEAREIMHFALLVGYGALLINPYLAFDSIDYMLAKKLYLQSDKQEYVKNMIKALEKALLKTMAKMGISSVQSYRGAQIFEALGLSQKLIDKYFKGTVSRIEGLDIEALEKETRLRHTEALNAIKKHTEVLENDGEYQWRKDGVKHILTPEAIAKIQEATSRNDYKAYKEFSGIINDQSKKLLTIRGLFKLKKQTPISLDEVEPVEAIMKRFVTGAMSYGSISKEAHEALAMALNEIGGRSNSGEGGELSERFKDNRRSATKQIASGRFGVTTSYLINADELQIKMAQGAKPGEGGQLPGHKVDKEIGKTRHTTPGIGLISPPPHHDIYSIEDLAQLIFDLKNVNPKARISVKLVSEAGVGVVASGVAKAHSEMILISGHDGGTGASPLSSIKHAGLPWELGLAEANQVLKEHKLRNRVVLQVDGKLKTGRDVIFGALLGAEEFGFATMPLVVLGCIMMRKCHTNMCPVGIATQSEELRAKFVGKYKNVITYFRFLSEEIREIMAELGVRKLEELIGRTDFLEADYENENWKSRKVELSKILYKNADDHSPNICTEKQDFGMDKIKDLKLISEAEKSIEAGEKTEIHDTITNADRSLGAMLSGIIAKKYGEEGLPEDTIKINLKGYAGQSFGVFGMSGITIDLEGESNDYIGKGLFGAKLIVRKPKDAAYDSTNNIIGGNAVLYGAIKGELYLNGVAGERFCVRNSGAVSVTEGVGDHGCEYMTGGRAVILGRVGKNFGAGMSGGIAYVYDVQNKLEKRLNKEMVEIYKPEPVYEAEIKKYVENHFKYTQSEIAREILSDWDNLKNNFKVVVSPKYNELFLKEVIS